MLRIIRWLYLGFRIIHADNIGNRVLNSLTGIRQKLNLLRIGTCGAVQPDIPLGAFIYSEISIGCDGLLGWYKDGEKLMLKDYEAAFKAHCGWKDGLASPYFVKASEEMITASMPIFSR